MFEKRFACNLNTMCECCVCVYVCMCLCICMHMYACVCVYVCICMHVFVYKYACVCVYVCICMHVFVYMYACVCVYVYKCLCICMHVFVYMYACVCVCVCFGYTQSYYSTSVGYLVRSRQKGISSFPEQRVPKHQFVFKKNFKTNYICSLPILGKSGSFFFILSGERDDLC